MAETARVTEKGQVTISKRLREKYDLDPGDEVLWVDTDEGIVVKKRTRTGGRGLLVLDDLSKDERKEVGRELVERLRNRRDQER